MRIDNWEKMTQYMETASATPLYQSALYLAVKNAVDQGCPQISVDRQRGTILQLAAYFDAIELDNPYDFITKEFEEFEVGQKDGRHIYDALLRGDMILPAPEEMETSLRDIRDKYSGLRDCLKTH